MRYNYINILIWIAFVIIAILVNLDITGSSVILIVYGGLMTIAYLFFTKWLLKFEKVKRNNWLAPTASIIYGISSVALVFNLKHYPGDNIITLICIILVVFLMIFSLIVKANNEEDRGYYNKIILQALIFHIALSFTYDFIK